MNTIIIAAIIIAVAITWRLWFWVAVLICSGSVYVIAVVLDWADKKSGWQKRRISKRMKQIYERRKT